MTVPKLLLWNGEWNPESIEARYLSTFKNRTHLLEILYLSTHFFTRKRAFELIQGNLGIFANALISDHFLNGDIKYLVDGVLAFSTRSLSELDSLEEQLRIVELASQKIG
jgi:hypothetical protein